MSDSATLWTVACQAPLSMGFSRQEDWSGFPCAPPGDLPNPGIEPTSPVAPTLEVDFFTIEPLEKPILDPRTQQIVLNKQTNKISILLGLLLSHFSRVRLCATP